MEKKEAEKYLDECNIIINPLRLTILARIIKKEDSVKVNNDILDFYTKYFHLEKVTLKYYIDNLKKDNIVDSEYIDFLEKNFDEISFLEIQSINIIYNDIVKLIYSQRYCLKNSYGEFIENIFYNKLRTCSNVCKFDIGEVKEKIYLFVNDYINLSTITEENSCIKAKLSNPCNLVKVYGENPLDIVTNLFSLINNKLKVNRGGIGININGLFLNNNNPKDIINNIQQLLVLSYDKERSVSINYNINSIFSTSYQILDLCNHENKNNSKENINRRCLTLVLDEVFINNVKKRKFDNYLTLPYNEQTMILDTLSGEEYLNKYEELLNVIPKSEIKEIPMLDYLNSIADNISMTGFPFIAFSESMNKYTPEGVLGKLDCVNLCTEIIQYTDNKGTNTSCNIGSLNLLKIMESVLDEEKDKPYYFISEATLDNFFKEVNKYLFDLILFLNRLIIINSEKKLEEDFNYNSLSLGIGYTGLASIISLLGESFDSKKSIVFQLNLSKEIYYSSLEHSILIGKNIEKYLGKGDYSNLLYINKDFYSDNKLLYTKKLENNPKLNKLFDKMINFDKEREEYILTNKEFIINGNLISLMPTNRTAIKLGCSEGAYPFVKNVYNQENSSGNFLKINYQFLEYLLKKGKLSKMNLKNILSDNYIMEEDEFKLFKTAFDYDPLKLLDIIGLRNIFIDGGFSCNIYVNDKIISGSIIVSVIIKSINLDIKTIYYYLLDPKKGWKDQADRKCDIKCSTCSL